MTSEEVRDLYTHARYDIPNGIIEIIKNYNKISYRKKFSIDFEYGIDIVPDNGWMSYYTAVLGEKIYPIGTAYTRHATVFITDTGKIVLTFDEFIGFYENMNEAINKIINDEKILILKQ